MLQIVSFLLIFGLAHANPPGLYTSPEMNPFVVGGQSVNISDYRFTVVCFLFGSFSCGGSIIDKYWILTAAHCTCTQFQYGVSDRHGYASNIVDVAECIRYPGWQSYQKNDVQLCRLKTEIPLYPLSEAGTVKLPSPKWEVEGDSFKTESHVLGWGYDTNGMLPLRLQRGDYYVMNNTDCKKVHQGVADVYDFNCCNGVPGGGVADCNGDSGGPIITKKDGQVVQYCIVSWSVKPCKNEKYPAVGTKTSHYVEWIAETTGLKLEDFTV